MNSTCQIGKGAAIAARSGYPVVCDFRSADIANGGQGAPIVSIFDRQVLGDYELLMNLGGIANITSLLSEKPIGFDIGPCNQILNYLANMRGLEYDENGRLAASGEVVPDLLEELISIKYLRRPVPKTLDNTEIQNTYIPLFESNQESIENQLRTAIAFIIKSIKYSISQLPGIKTSEEIKILVTGGGANNEFLISQLKAEIDGFNWIFPDKDLIDFKEAIMMAYLAYLRLQKMPNVLASVTGAKKDTVNGVIYWP